MSIDTIGLTIARLRKEKGITQEELAKSVCVSPQAVSKWENGGLPDTELLPKIADFFEVSIDTLFSRHIEDYGDLKTALAKAIASSAAEKRFDTALKYCWIIELAMAGVTESDMALEELMDNNYRHSQMLFQYGFSTFSMTKKLPYFFILPEPPTGYKEGLFDKESYINLFRLLGDSDVMNCLYMLYERENRPFTLKLFENKLNLSVERAKQIIDMLMPYKLIKETEIELNDAVQTVYNFKANPAFIALLAISKEMIKPPVSFYYYSGARNGKYL